MVARFFQDALVERDPLQMAIEIETRVLEIHARHWVLGRLERMLLLMLRPDKRADPVVSCHFT